MDSSFLTAINIGLALYAILNFIRIVIQFGLPNHPARFTVYLVTLCVTSYFVMRASTDLGFIPPFFFWRWRSLPLVIGSFALLMQLITCIGHYGHVQQKIISRIPLILGLLVFSYFPQNADAFLVGSLVAAGLFLTVSVGKARYIKRMFFKLCFFLILSAGLKSVSYWAYLAGEFLLVFVLFYFFIIQQGMAVQALVEQRHAEDLGVSA
jgi:hypothetical protein